jgi:3-hydroxybenzoate 6-monooxygenase
MALEDAVALAHMVAMHLGEIEAALDAYQERRVLRTARVQLESRALGEHIYHPAGVHARLRNAVLGAKSSADFCDSLAWLYGGTGLDGNVVGAPVPRSAAHEEWETKR